MYVYLVDAELASPKHTKIISRIETRLGELGIGGNVHRLTILKSAEETIKDELKRSPNAVVAIGSEAFFHEVARYTIGTGIPAGFIPMEKSEWADVCGIPEGVAACDIIASRILVDMPAARAHAYQFMDYVTVPNIGTRIFVDDSYQITFPDDVKEMYICNAVGPHGMLPNTSRGPWKLHIVGQPVKSSGFFQRQQRATVIEAYSILIKGKLTAGILHSGKKVAATPAEIRLTEEKIRCIVGKQRIVGI